jgi:hypothetical protein
LKTASSSKLNIIREKNFNMIHESLADIMKTLRRLENKPVTTSPSATEEAGSSGASPYVPAKVFEGESSFSKHSEQATLSAEITAAAPESIQTAEVVSSLSSLRSLLEGQSLPSSIDELRFPDTPLISPRAKVDLPPMPLVIAVLKRANSKNQQP